MTWTIHSPLVMKYTLESLMDNTLTDNTQNRILMGKKGYRLQFTYTFPSAIADLIAECL
jgi:hypothetical protein